MTMRSLRPGARSSTKNIKIATLIVMAILYIRISPFADRDIATFKSTVLLAEKLGVKVIVKRMPWRYSYEFAAQLDHVPLATEYAEIPVLAMAGEAHSLLEGSGEVRARAWNSPACARDAPKKVLRPADASPAA